MSFAPSPSPYIPRAILKDGVFVERVSKNPEARYIFRYVDPRSDLESFFIATKQIDEIVTNIWHVDELSPVRRLGYPTQYYMSSRTILKKERSEIEENISRALVNMNSIAGESILADGVLFAPGFWEIMDL